MSGDFEVLFLGTGGSCAFNNGRRARSGMNTPCVAVRAGPRTLVFDAGAGICGLDAIGDCRDIHLFLSHYHADHLEGLLFCPAVFDPAKQFHIYGARTGIGGAGDTVAAFFSPPFHPVGTGCVRASIAYTDIEAGAEIPLGGGVTVATAGLSHPGGSIGFRAAYDGRSVCYLTDVELANHRDDGVLTAFVRGADLLIAEAFFEDGQCRPGWGHSSPGECAELAKRAGAKRLALFHYPPSGTDEKIKTLEKSAKAVFTNTFASADRLRVTV